MFLPIFLFELKYRLRQPATWIYFVLLALMAGLLTAAAGGAFGADAEVSLGGPGVFINSPHAVTALLVLLSAFGLLITAALLGNPVYRDFEHRLHLLLYTLPLSKRGYLGGRFAGSFVVGLLVFSGLLLGAGLGAVAPGVEAHKVGAFHLQAYLGPFLLVVLPNVLVPGALFFTLATLTRNVLSVYVGAVLLLLGYLLSLSLLGSLDNELLAAGLDAFGLTALRTGSRYLTAGEKNTLLPFSEYLLLNRVLWLGLALGLLALCYARFRFGAFAAEPRAGKAVAAAEPTRAASRPLTLPRVAQRFGPGLYLRQWASLTKLELRSNVRSAYLLAMLGAAALFVLVGGWQVVRFFDTPTYPVTHLLLQLLEANLAFFMPLISTFYAGELVWRERDVRAALIADALPVPGWVPLLSKLATLALIQVLVLVVVLASSVLLQTLQGYHRYEPGLYLTDLFGLQLPGYLLLGVLALLVQVLVNNKYLGYFVMVLYFAGRFFQGQLGIRHKLLDYAGGPVTPYSDLNGYGHFLPAFAWFKLYWAAGALLLLLAASLLWVRGPETRLRWRLAEARRRWNRPAWVTLVLGAVVMLGSGGFIFYNTNVLNRYQTPEQEQAQRAAYEQQYGRYRHLPQPQVVSVSLRADIFPAQRAVRLAGQYWLRNPHSRPLDTVLVLLAHNPQVHTLTLGRPAATLLRHDAAAHLRLFRLARPLAPGDSVPLTLALDYQEQGFPNDGSNTDIVHNGTFLRSDYLPLIGYQENGEVADAATRQRLGLSPKPRQAPASDRRARQHPASGHGADRIRFEAVVSTAPDQIALAPGRLLKEWHQSGRRYFHYRVEQPMLNFYALLSARYQVYRSAWIDSAGRRTVPIEVYYQPGHAYNVRRMADAAQQTLAYCARHFSPYQHPQLRIVEFPAYRTFAQSFAGLIPFSEGIGFIAKVDTADPAAVDFPFYVTAHEVAHQWWGHQVVGADVQGHGLLTETTAQFSALMVMRRHYGPHMMARFLRHELNGYLNGRAQEHQKEMPLVRGENQKYLHYGKGAGAMYALQDYIGADKVTLALGRFVRQHAYRGAPYCAAPDLVAEFRRVTPDSLQSLVTDLFERIVLYDNRVLAATAARLPSGQFKIKVTVESYKLRADSLGNETSVPLRDYLPVAVYGTDQPAQPLLLTKRRLSSGRNELELIVAQKPGRVVVDPYHELADRRADDNVCAVRW